MKRLLLVVAAASMILAVLVLDAADRPAIGDGPQFTADGQLIRPKNYREWIYLSSGLGMTYGPAAEAARDNNPTFDNVFVNPGAYRASSKPASGPTKPSLCWKSGPRNPRARSTTADTIRAAWSPSKQK